MTAVRSDSGLVIDVASLGPAKHSFLAAGFAPAQVFSGHGILLGYSAENSGSTDNSLDASAVVTGPAAGATIVSLVLPAGTWTVGWTVGYGAGVVAAAEQDNMQLTGVPTTLNAVIPAVANQQQVQQSVTFTTAGATIAVKAIAAGTGTANYTAQLVATPVSAGFLRAYDGRGAPTEQVLTSFLAEVASESEWLGDSGTELQMGLWVAATANSIAVTLFYIVLQD